MKIYTGYFAQVKKYRERGLVTVSIARFKPKYYSGLEFKALAPTPNMLKMSQTEYDVHFDRILSLLNAKMVAANLELASEGRDVVLLCYESLGKHCHRHTVKNWLVKNGVPCEEYLLSIPPDVTFDAPKQRNLFD